MVTNFLLFMLLSIGPTTTQPINPQETTGINGEWQLLHENIGISPTHMQLLHNDKVVMFDRTDFGPSNISLPFNHCRYDPFDSVLQKDCTAHSILYDIRANTFRPLSIQTDTWCSSGAVLPNGTLVQTGGYNDGDHTIRTMVPCDDGTCDWIEFPGYLKERRWFSTDQLLPDGRIIIVGGRRQFSYEFYPANPPDYFTSVNSSSFLIDFLRGTADWVTENNLYPFVHLLPDGNLFIFANVQSVVFDYEQNKVVKHLPPITGDNPRNYPSSGSSVLLPLDENNPVEAEVMICGGAPRDALLKIRRSRNFSRAIPPYLAPEYNPIRPEIVKLPSKIKYKKPLMVTFTVLKFLKLSRVTVRIIAPSFTTHSLGMNQRMVVLKEDKDVSFVGGSSNKTYTIGVVGPSTAKIAPPGYYLLYLVHAGIPSHKGRVWGVRCMQTLAISCSTAVGSTG